MASERDVESARQVRKLAPSCPETILGERIPKGLCRLCWRDRLVWRDGIWMLDHIGPFSACLHHCHDDEGFLGSTS
jgi:hypothetical protein